MLFDKVYKHSGDLGDIIYSLPVLKTYGKGILAIDDIKNLKSWIEPKGIQINLKKTDGTPSGICKNKFNFIKPLLEKQKYIKEVVRCFKNFKFAINLDFFRLDKDSKFIYEKYINIFDVPLQQYEEAWIDADKKKIADVVFSRSNRYKNYDFPWHSIVKKYKKESVFVGLEEEYDSFIRTFGFVDYYKVKNAWDLACVINGSDLFVGNQSLAYSINEGLKHKSIQETSPKLPDCIFVRENASFFLQKNIVKFQYLDKKSICV